MPWTASRWPPAKSDAIDTDGTMNEVRAALEERDGLVQALWVPGPFSRWDPLRGTPRGGMGSPFSTVANFQYEIQEMLTGLWPLRWWDAGRDTLYTLAGLCQDAFGGNGWTYDLTETDAEGQPAHPWTPPCALLFEELYQAISRLDRVRILPTTAEPQTRDSVYRLTFGISQWVSERAASFAEFDGEDDGAAVGLAYDVGMGAEITDDGDSEQWSLESREMHLVFDTASLAGYAVRKARLDFATAAPEGSADFEGSFTVEVADATGSPLGEFASTDLGAKQIEVPADAITPSGNTVLVVRSAEPDAEDRAAWAPEGPDYTSTYREGISICEPVRLIVEVDFEYRG